MITIVFSILSIKVKLIDMYLHITGPTYKCIGDDVSHEVIRFMRYPCVILLQVSLMADVLRRRGADKGDRVIIYMPMIPEALITMLACARIGAVHSLVFGGFSARELSVRVDHCKVCC